MPSRWFEKGALGAAIMALVAACSTTAAESVRSDDQDVVRGTASCAPMDARGVGLCRMIVGYAWNGSSCQPISGCDCAGADCAKATEANCDAVAASCAGDAGATDAAPDAPPADACAPMDARGEGLCKMIVGHAWNGTACVTIGGCKCVGADCARATAESCDAVAAACAPKADAAAPATNVCDARRVSCRRAPPVCPDGQAPSVKLADPADPSSLGCWGPCVPIESCACSGPSAADECPDGSVCWGHRKACGPVVR